MRDPGRQVLRRQSLALRAAQDSLGSFLSSWSTEGGEPLETLNKGDALLLGRFPNGTVVRYSRDMWRDDFFGVDQLSWGIITQMEDGIGGFRDAIVGIPANDTDSYANLMASFHPQLTPQRIIMGKVVHYRYTQMRIPTGNVPEFSTLYRFNRVEIWKLGDMERKQNRPKGFKQRRK